MFYPGINVQLHRYDIGRLLKGQPDMDFVSAAARDECEQLERDKNPFNKIIAEYTHRWARFMQMEMYEGKPVAEIAEKTAEFVNCYPLTPTQFDIVAGAFMPKWWVHGEAFKEWYSSQPQ